MNQIIQPLVVESQQLKVNYFQNMMLSMSAEEERKLFSERLKILCKDKEWPENTWQSELKAIFTKLKKKISQQAVSKWLNAEAFPNPEKLRDLCDFFKCSYEWLCTGNGDKYPVRAKDTDDFLKDNFGRTQETLSVAESGRVKEFLLLTPEQQLKALAFGKEEQTGRSEETGKGKQNS